ncbi:MAG: glycosyltransferase family 2 protein [Candidatus Bathyarchaeota archaeon]|nr:glycosyltransferase family 2 protein [Candidatus Bathyarchaeota archaeon]
MKISVIVPTYKRLRTLLPALHSLQEQTLSDFEILVVDNAADTAVEQAVVEFNRSAIVPARYLPEPHLGLHNARHAGARAANGEILVFTDDDATFAPGWLQAYARAFDKHPEMAAAGGPVKPIWEVAPPQWLLKFIGDIKVFPLLSLMEPYDIFHLDPKGYFIGVNMAIRRDVLFKVGGFNPESFGDIWLGDGETGLYQKLWRQKMLVGYVSDAVVYHHIPPNRMTVDYFRRRMENEGACDMYARYHNRVPNWLLLCKHACAIAIRNSIYWVVAVLLKDRNDARSLHTQLHAARTQSQFKYVVRLIFDRDFQRLVLKADWLT